MQGRLKVPPNTNWLDIVEILSVLGSIGGSIASVVTQQVVFASIPLSLSVTLNLVNRRRLLDETNQSNQTAIAQLVQENNEIKQSNQTAIASFVQQNGETQTKLATLTEQLAEVQQLTSTLGQDTSNLENYTQSLHNEQTKIVELVGYLQEIETCTQTIRINPNYAETYYNRGIIYQRLGDKEGAIGDYTQAIRINPSYAQAYHTRGLARADLGDKKGALNDLREAAKHFFEEGDIANYQIARDLSKKFHELSSQPRTDAPEQVAVECLFS
jgi:tetratricopeptide (TPR) repeat protein